MTEKAARTKAEVRRSPEHINELIDENWRFYNGLLAYERPALRMIREIDVMKLDPIVVGADEGPNSMLFEYLRVTLSHAVQQSRWFKGRITRYLVLDRTSGGVLGFFAHGEAQLPWKPFEEWLGAEMICGPRTNAKAVEIGLREAKRLARMNNVIQMRRCIPIPEFGLVTGGKLLTLMAMSREVIGHYETRYGFPVMAALTKNLGGKSSQYNRLHQRGFEYGGDTTLAPIGESAGQVVGFYVQKCYENAKDYLTAQSLDTGKPLTYTLADQSQYWKERWLPNRIKDFTDNGWVRPDHDKYRLSAQIEKRMTDVSRYLRARGYGQAPVIE